MNFKIECKSNNARCGEYNTPHGTFETPNFMPVGTRASVKGLDFQRLLDLGTQITLVNTYHLWLRPGHKVIKELGGIHKFCGWKGPILSDSGGFQVFSLKGIRKLTEEGVHFKSHIDGTDQFLSPEKAIEIQQDLGVDIAMVLDECPAGDTPFAECKKSLEMTHRWAKRCLEARTREDMSLFGITQGAIHPKLRQRAAEELGELPFDGMAIGGLSVGEPKEQMYEVLSYHVDQLPHDKIRYLMGVGTPEDIVEAVYRGVDLFDCVMPTRSGRFGRAYVSGEKTYINIKNSVFRTEQDPVDLNCDCFCCQNYSKAYIHHLFRVGEMMGPVLLSVHNLHFYMNLMSGIRKAIREDTYESFYRKEKARWAA